MSKSRDLASLASSATGLATDAELSAAVAAIDLTNVTRIVPVDSNISVPNAPTSVSATTDNTQSSVSFVASTTNGGSAILGYTVISSPGNIKKSGTTSPIMITGLTNGTAYTFTVKAHNIAGSSAASSASSSVTPARLIPIDYLVIAGGGGGASGDGVAQGGGGGAGGLRSTVTATGGGGTLETALSCAIGSNFTVTVGTFGAGGASGGADGFAGSNSVFSTITSVGGGRGRFTQIGGNGGSGGGGGSTGGGNTAGGTGTANQGFDGGTSFSVSPYPAGGGGGAGGPGENFNNNAGAGLAVSITGTSVTYARGGMGGTNGVSAGTANRGNGGDGVRSGAAYAGGSGVVILRYLTTDGTITIGAGLTGSTATSGSYTVATITAGTGNVSWA
jgi:hypothetical protein